MSTYGTPVRTTGFTGGDTNDDVCQYCRAFVDAAMKRVWAGNDGVMHACPECVTHAELKHGAAAIEDYEPGQLAAVINTGRWPN